MTNPNLLHLDLKSASNKFNHESEEERLKFAREAGALMLFYALSKESSVDVSVQFHQEDNVLFIDVSAQFPKERFDQVLKMVEESKVVPELLTIPKTHYKARYKGVFPKSCEIEGGR